ncbi:MAG: GIY-YIG nuclease family protein [Candidatus Moranbacteria bacterium]|nr:GIY-YIG nuclease family protein [Candidatus Moranbacteria bacterium]
MIIVYVIESQIRKYRYIGITNNLERRLEEHSKTKKSYTPFEVLLTEIFQDYQTARIREKFLKSGRGRKYLDSLK